MTNIDFDSNTQIINILHEHNNQLFENIIENCKINKDHIHLYYDKYKEHEKFIKINSIITRNNILENSFLKKENHKFKKSELNYFFFLFKNIQDVEIINKEIIYINNHEDKTIRMELFSDCVKGCCASGKISLFEDLLLCIDNRNEYYQHYLSICSLYGQLNMLKYLLNNFTRLYNNTDDKYQIQHFYSIIFEYACSGGNINIIKYLIEQRIDIKRIYEVEKTYYLNCLYKCSFSGNIELFELLNEVVDFDPNNIIQFIKGASENNQLQMIEHLLGKLQDIYTLKDNEMYDIIMNFSFYELKFNSYNKYTSYISEILDKLSEEKAETNINLKIYKYIKNLSEY